MNHPALELQAEIFSILSANTQLSALIGAGRIYDDVPPGKKPPYVTFGKSLHADWSTDTETGMEHEIELHAWSQGNGRKEIFNIQQIIHTALQNLGGAMTDHHLVNFTLEHSQVEMRDKHRAFRGISRFRAVTEPIT